MAWNQAQLDALEDAIARGSLSMEYEGKKETFRSLRDMLALRELMQRELGVAAKRACHRDVRTKAGKGLLS